MNCRKILKFYTEICREELTFDERWNHKRQVVKAGMVARYQYARARHVKRWFAARMAGKRYPATKGVIMMIRLYKSKLYNVLERVA